MVIASRWNSCHPFSGELQTNAYADAGLKVGTVGECDSIPLKLSHEFCKKILFDLVQVCINGDVSLPQPMVIGFPSLQSAINKNKLSPTFARHSALKY